MNNAEIKERVMSYLKDNFWRVTFDDSDELICEISNSLSDNFPDIIEEVDIYKKENDIYEDEEENLYIIDIKPLNKVNSIILAYIIEYEGNDDKVYIENLLY